jgi:translation initiation factor eIF-2B subunit epsilon
VWGRYAARVGNLHSYDAVSMDVLRRWTYPLVPDSRLLQSEHTIQFKRHNVYLSDEVGLTWGCELEENVLVGFASTVGREGAPTTRLTNCIIGKRCKIGAGVRISNSYVWDDVVIGDGCQIDRCILANGVELKPEVRVESGSVLAPGVVIDTGVTIKMNSMITLESCSAEDAADFDDEDGEADAPRTPPEWDVAVVGPGGKGQVWDPEDEDDAEVFAWGTRGSVADAIAPAYKLDEEVTESESESDDDEHGDREYSGASAGGGSDGPEHDDDGDFNSEILDLIRERVIAKFDSGMEDSVPLSELALESQGSRSAHNKTLNDVVDAMVHAVMACSNDSEVSTTDLVQRIKKIFITISPVLSKYITTPACQGLFIASIESASIAYPNAGEAFQTVLHAMYEEDLVLEEMVLRWHRNAQMAVLSPAQVALRTRVQPFIEWLQNAEEESNDDDDESDSD